MLGAVPDGRKIPRLVHYGGPGSVKPENKHKQWNLMGFNLEEVLMPLLWGDVRPEC